MKSVVKSSKCPSELSTPVYVHLLYYPQLEAAENGVILNYCNETPYVTVKVVCYCIIELTVIVGLIC
jgi:hypothetical protein